MKIFKILAVIFLLCFSSTSLHAEKVKVLVFNYPPFFSDAKIGDLGNGYWMDIMKQAFKEAGMEPDLLYRPLARARSEFANKKYPLFLGSRVPPHLDAQESYVFGYFNVYFNYFKKNHEGKLSYKTLSDLKTHRIGVIRGTPVAMGLKRAGLNLDATTSNDSLVKKLYHKRVDLWATTFLSARYMVNKHFPQAVNDFTRIDKPFFTGTIALVYMKGDAKTKKTVQRFAKGMDVIKKNGTYMAIIEKYWQGADIPKEVLSKDMR